jgi:hypothetical protein
MFMLAKLNVKFDLIYEEGILVRIEVKKISGREVLANNEINDAVNLIKTHHQDICRKWTEFFVMGKRINIEKITKKI